MLTGCVEEYEAELPESETNLLVVNGTICSNQYNSFQLTWSTSLNNTINATEKDGYYDYYSSSYISDEKEPQPVYGARVTVCGTDGSEYECWDVGADYGIATGVYSNYIPELDSNVSYYLTIQCNGEIYQSTPEKPICTPDIERLEYFQKDSLSNVEILLTSAAPDDPDKTTYYTWDYSETWEIRPARTTRMYFDVEKMSKVDVYDRLLYPERGWKFGHNETILTGSTAHYADAKFSKFQLMDIPRYDERVSWYYCFDLTQRAISKAEYEYEIACRQAGWEMGGLFTPQPSALPTNIRCLTSSKRAIGYVGCSQNVSMRRLYIDGTKISRILPGPASFIKFDDCSEIDCLYMVERGYVLYGWDDGRMIQQPLSTFWGYPEDFDVRLHGATEYKPYYMPPFDEE